MNVRPWNEHIWFSPCYVIGQLAITAQTGDKRKFYKNKEAWICAVVMICHSKIEPAEWWIQIPKNDPPDILAMKLIPTKDGLGNDMSFLQVEVFEISEHDQESIEKSVERKLGNKDYSGMTLIGFVRRMQFFEHERVATYIKALKPKALCIFLIVREENNTNISFISVYPQCVKFKCDFGSFCKTTNQRDFIELSRSTKNKMDNNTTNDILTIIP